MKKIMMSLCLAGAAFAAQAQSLTFATEATYPPFESADKSGKIIGFDVDIMNALCKQIKASCTIVNAPFDSLIPSLALGKYDAVIAALAITPEREKVVNFTQSYYDATVSVVAKKGSGLALNAKSLKGKTFGVQQDTTFYQYLKAKYGSVVTIKTYQSEESAFLDLTAGRVDAVMGDTPLVSGWLKEADHAKNYASVAAITDVKFFGPGNGIAVKKGNAALLKQLNSALVQIKKNGNYQKIVNKWLST